MEYIQMGNIMPALQMYLSEITEAQMERLGTKIGPVKRNEKVVGCVEEELFKRLYCVSNSLKARAVEQFSKSQNVSTDNEEEQLKQEAGELGALAEIARDMFWYEVNKSFGLYADKESTSGVRDGWKVVTFTQKNPLKGLMGSIGIELPEE